MSRQNLLKEIYSERRHENDSISELYFNYSNAVKHWLIAESKTPLNPLSKYRRKDFFAIITAVVCLTLITLISIGCTDHGSQTDNGFLLLTRLLVTVLQPLELAATEITVLLFVLLCVCFGNIGTFVGGDSALLSFEALRSASSRRPNFLLGHDVAPSSGIATERYMDAFKYRRECLVEELGREPSSNGGVTLAVVVSVVLALFTQQSTAIVVLTLVVSALSLYFLTGRLTYERREELIELAIYEMIIQDLQEIELTKAPADQPQNAL